ncbi:transmembrane 9 superfamily member 1 [Tanacetum coccineum]
MMLMRTLRNDYAKYAREDDDLETLERDVSEESALEIVHRRSDVFRHTCNVVFAVSGLLEQVFHMVRLNSNGVEVQVLD